MAMVKIGVDMGLERRQIVVVAHKAVVVQISGAQFDNDDVIMAMQPRALVVMRQMMQLM
jgi:plastocyanin domain-containing protein